MEAKIVALVLVAVFGALGLDWLNVLPSLSEMLKFLQDAPAPEPTGLISAAVLQVCSLYDEKARAFRSPFTVPHVDVAIRAIRGLLAQGDTRNEIVAHAEDHVLYHHGAFDDATGQFQAQAPVVVARVAQLRPEVDLSMAPLLRVKEATPATVKDLREAFSVNPSEEK